MAKKNLSRLEIIKRTPYIIQCDVLFKDFKWLIEQAERVEDLEVKLSNLHEIIHSENMEMVESFNNLHMKNIRFRYALEEIAKDNGTPYATMAQRALDENQ